MHITAMQEKENSKYNLISTRLTSVAIVGLLPSYCGGDPSRTVNLFGLRRLQ